MTLTSLASIASGGSAGPEAPLVQIIGDERLHEGRLISHFLLADRRQPAAEMIGQAFADLFFVACDGVCLTVVAKGQGAEAGWFDVDISAETVSKTNLDTWEQQHWQFDGNRYMHLNDMKLVDEKIILALFQSSQPAHEGLYEFNPITGALEFRSAIPGASLIIDTNA